jgi:thioesterase domain-containing protein
LAHLREFARGEPKEYLRKRRENALRRLYRAVGREHELSPDARHADSEQRQTIKRIFDTNMRALQQYRPEAALDSELLLFRPENPEHWIGVRGMDPLNGWGQFFRGGITEVRLPGTHDSILHPANQAAIAECIISRLDRLEELETAQPTRDVSGYAQRESATRIAAGLAPNGI